MNIDLKDPGTWYTRYADLKEDKKFDCLIHTLKSNITDNFFEEAGMNNIIFDMMILLKKNKNHDEMITLYDSTQKYRHLYCDWYFMDKYCIDYYLYKDDKKGIRKHLSGFLEQPVESIDFFFPVLQKIMYYGHRDLALEISSKLFDKLKGAEGLIPGTENDFANIIFIEKLYDIYTDIKKGVSIDRYSISLYLKKYNYDIKECEFDRMQYFWSENGPKKYSYEDFVMNHDYFSRDILYMFLEYAHSKNVSFAAAYDIWHIGFNSFEQDFNELNESKDFDSVFILDEEKYDNEISGRIDELFSKQTTVSYAVAWGMTYMYDFLYKYGFISDDVYEDALRSIDSIKVDIIIANATDMWEYGFINKWDKPEGIPKKEFVSDKEIIEESFSTIIKFEPCDDELASDLEPSDSLSSDYVVDESTIKPLIEDFETFMDYIDKNAPKLTKKGEVLGNKLLFELNDKMIHKKDVSKPTFKQKSYPLLSLLFDLCTGGGLYMKQADERGNLYLKATERKEEYCRLNIYEKYMFLLETYWTHMDFGKLLGNSFLYDFSSVNSILGLAALNNEGDRIVKGTFSGVSEDDPIFIRLTLFIYHMSFFGFWNYKEIEYKDKNPTRYDDKLLYVELKRHGIEMSRILSDERPLENWNIKSFMDRRFNEYGLHIIPGKLKELKGKMFDNWDSIDKLIDEYNEQMMKEKIEFWHPFKSIFSEGALKNTIKADITPNATKGNYIFKVSLSGKVWRKIKLSHNHTLYDLHMEIQNAFHFDDDHLYTFFMEGKRSSKNNFHSDMCGEGPYVDHAVIGELGLYKGKRILYLFDYGDMWQFMINVVEINENEEEISIPEIIEIKGEAPKQYNY